MELLSLKNDELNLENQLRNRIYNKIRNYRNDDLFLSDSVLCASDILCFAFHFLYNKKLVNCCLEDCLSSYGLSSDNRFISFEFNSGIVLDMPLDYNFTQVCTWILFNYNYYSFV